MILSIKIILQSLHPRLVSPTYESSRIIDCRNTLILLFPFFLPLKYQNINISITNFYRSLIKLNLKILIEYQF